MGLTDKITAPVRSAANLAMVALGVAVLALVVALCR